MGLFYRTQSDLKTFMDSLHRDATAFRGQVSVDTMPGGARAGTLPAHWTERFFDWYANWSRFYWHKRPQVDDTLLPSDDGLWASTAGHAARLKAWKDQYRQQTGRLPQPYSPPLPPASSGSGLERGLENAALGMGAAVGLGAVAVWLLRR